MPEESTPASPLSLTLPPLEQIESLPAVSFVPTPIGNLKDISLRALETLASVDFIACEDTRHSLRLLNHYGIQKPLVSYHEHNEKRRVDDLVARLQAGETMAVISDAGMPAISDPGFRLIQGLIENELSYTVLPGASSTLTALVASGFTTHSFFYGGFLSVKKGKRRKQLEQAGELEYPSIFFESPHRLKSTLEILNEHCPTASVVVARELTKTYEQLIRGTSLEVYEYYKERTAKGEIVLMLQCGE